MKFAIPLLLLIALAGCARESAEAPIDLPATPVLSVRAHWGVVSASYLRAFDSPSMEDRIAFLLRSGDILEITAKSNYTDEVRSVRDYWYHVLYNGKEGWVFGEGLDLYESRERAENASRLLTNG